MSLNSLEKLKENLAMIAKGFVPKELPDEIFCKEEVTGVKKFYDDVSAFIAEMAAGNLEVELDHKGPLAGSLRMLQASLKHMVWQTREVANGDFSQRSDLMGEFAESFNQMAVRLDSLEKLKESLTLLAKGIIPKELPENLTFRDELSSIKKFYEDISAFIQDMSAGKLEVELEYKGPLAGSLKMLQANLKHLVWQAGEVANGDFSQRIDLMGEFAESFNMMVVNLNDSFTKFEEKNNELLKIRAEFDKDIKLAEDAQNKMMKFLAKTDISRGEKYSAALQRVSGDFYHEFMDESGNHNIFVGDATGHGVSAGLVTMMARTAIESVPQGLSTDEMLKRINGLLCNCLPDDMYISGVYARLHPDGKLLVASGGHFPVVIIRDGSGALELTAGGGMPLGMFDSEIAQFDAESYQLNKGDRIYFFTDGAVECRNSQEQFGVKRLHSLLQKLHAEDVETAIAEIIGELWEFSAEIGFEDDVLLLTHEFTGGVTS